MEFIDIFESLGNVGIGSIIASLVALIIWVFEKVFGIPSVLTNILYKILDRFIKVRIENLKEISTIKESDILNHDIFNFIDFWTYSKIPTFQFSTEYRTVVFRKYLTIFLQKHKSNIHKWVHDKKFGEMENSELWNSLLSLLNDTIRDYEIEMELAGIPKVIIEKMKVVNNNNLSLTIILLEGICNSQFYQTEKNLLKVYSFLNILVSILGYTISCSQEVCGTINGQLKGLSMDGRTEP